MKRLEGVVVRGFYSSWLDARGSAIGMSEAVEGHCDGAELVLTVETSAELDARERAVAELVAAAELAASFPGNDRLRAAIAAVRALEGKS